MSVPVFAGKARTVALAAAAVAVLNNIVASTLIVAVYNFDLSLVAEPGSVIARGPAVAGLLRVGAVIDMVGYLALAPVVLYLHDRLPIKRPLLTLAGLGALFAGAIGAALFASAGPWLLETSTTSAAAYESARMAFGALEQVVLIGLWGTLEVFLLGVWLSGIAWHVRAEGRAFAWLTAIVAVGAFAYAARVGFSGQLPVTTLPDLFILGGLGMFVPWLAVLAVRLWRGR